MPRRRLWPRPCWDVGRRISATHRLTHLHFDYKPTTPEIVFRCNIAKLANCKQIAFGYCTQNLIYFHEGILFINLTIVCTTKKRSFNSLRHLNFYNDFWIFIYKYGWWYVWTCSQFFFIFNYVNWHVYLCVGSWRHRFFTTRKGGTTSTELVYF